MKSMMNKGGRTRSQKKTVESEREYAAATKQVEVLSKEFCEYVGSVTQRKSRPTEERRETLRARGGSYAQVYGPNPSSSANTVVKVRTRKFGRVS